MKRAAVVALIAIIAASCAGTKTSRTRITTPNPGPCTPVDVAVAPEVLTVVNQLAQGFNASSAAKLDRDTCVYARIWSVDSAGAVHRLLAGWPNPDSDGPRPVAWIPTTSAWAELLNERASSNMATIGPSLASTNLAIAMPKPMAAAVRRPLTWAGLAEIARRGWASYGHAAWGPFRLGKANPGLATDALLATIATNTDDQTTATLEHAVPYYGRGNDAYFDSLHRLDKAHAPLGYLSAVVTDAQALAAYNSKGPVHTPLVAVNAAADAPVLDTPFVFIGARAMHPDALAFQRYLQTPAAQAAFVAAGYRPAVKRVHVPTHVAAALDRWATYRRLARAIVLVDVSDSMGDIPRADLTKSKLQLAQRALETMQDSVGANDEVGLSIFSTKLGPRRTGEWLDLVPVRAWNVNSLRVVAAIRKLRPQTGSPLYAATTHVFSELATHYDPTRINALVLITDGFNEDEHDTNRALFALVAAHPQIHVFGVGVGNGADMTTLKALARATGGAVFDATNTLNTEKEIAAAVAAI
jgi:Ca-activated chloride channel family protein